MVTATAGERSMAGWRGLFAGGSSRGLAKSAEAEGLVQPAALLLPGPQEAISVQLDARTLAEIAPLLRLPGVRLMLTADRHLALALPNGGLLVFPAADPVIQAMGDAPAPLLARLSANPEAV